MLLNYYFFRKYLRIPMDIRGY